MVKKLNFLYSVICEMLAEDLSAKEVHYKINEVIVDLYADGLMTTQEVSEAILWVDFIMKDLE